ncbi:ABC transporter permease [Candidatus Thorarchaeota archaeon]|nr:MAG: ABC transporter permease [Candidatus Thorarchaeota archaeon]
MAAIPVGYEAFHNLRRKAVTLMCFVLASTMAIGITVYVDSYSIHEWDKNLDVGEVAIRVSGDLIESYVDDIKGIRGVTKAALLTTSHGGLIHQMNISGIPEAYGRYGRFLAINQEFTETFPNYVALIEGRYPLSLTEIAVTESIRQYFELKLGDLVRVEIGSSEENCTIVGIYKHPTQYSSPYYWDYESIAIIISDFINIYEEDFEIFVDVDRSRLSPFNPTDSLQYLNRIDENIRRIDPNYETNGYYSRIYVNDRLASGISDYVYWVQSLRIGEMLRSTSILLLVVLVTFLAIRYNVNERRYEESILLSRGASPGDLERVVTREVLALSMISCFVGIPFGLLLSRVAISAVGYFVFNPLLVFSEPILISLESLLISTIVSIALPMLTLGGYRAIYSTKKNVEEQRGRIAKISRGLGLIKWDVLVVLLSSLLLLAILSGGTVTTTNPLLAILMPIIPLPLFLGVVSLSMKALKRGANFLSRIMKRIVGEIPSSIGIRRIGKEASSAGAAAMVLVLAICLSWNSAIVDASLPVTVQNQTRLDIGADLTFGLDDYNYLTWQDFIDNVTNHELVESGTLVSQMTLFLSADYSGSFRFMGVHPTEYITIGYDYLGNRYNESKYKEMIESLASNKDGAVITKDIANSFNLVEGDILRATNLIGNDEIIVFRILGIVDALPEMPEISWWDGPVYFDYSFYVGSSAVLVNREYLGTKVDLISETMNYYCVGLKPGENGTIVAEDVISTGGLVAIIDENWDCVSLRVDEYTGNTQYKMERSLDTMLTVLTVGTIIGAFVIYAVEGVRARRREIALLRSVGATRSIILQSQAAEMLVLLLFSLFLLAGYSPLFLSTSIASASISSSSWFQVYPISVFPVIPWYTIIVVLGFFVGCMSMFILVIAALSSRINLASTLNTAWAEAGPYGGEF